MQTNREKLEKAVILARGLGTRMRQRNDALFLNKKQQAIADTGIKALMPIEGRPFLDYGLNALADAGYRQICLVIGPEHHELQTYYGETLSYKRLQVEFAIQKRPLGTADAVVAAEAFAGSESFLVINSDTYYPVKVLQELNRLKMPGLAVFGREDLLVNSNIPAERISKFAVVETNNQGYLDRIIEKPDAKTLGTLSEPIGVSMNCWRFDANIFPACRAINPSSRGELELPTAVQYAIEELGQKFRIVYGKGLVLDLTNREDISAVKAKLAGMEVQL